MTRTPVGGSLPGRGRWTVWVPVPLWWARLLASFARNGSARRLDYAVGPVVDGEDDRDAPPDPRGSDDMQPRWCSAVSIAGRCGAGSVATVDAVGVDPDLAGPLARDPDRRLASRRRNCGGDAAHTVPGSGVGRHHVRVHRLGVRRMHDRAVAAAHGQRVAHSRDHQDRGGDGQHRPQPLDRPRTPPSVEVGHQPTPELLRCAGLVGELAQRRRQGVLAQLGLGAHRVSSTVRLVISTRSVVRARDRYPRTVPGEHSSVPAISSSLSPP